jgi:signal transduction histidine kinase
MRPRRTLDRPDAGPSRYELAEGQSLRERRRFETLLRRLLIAFTAPGDQVDPLIPQWLGHLGECLRADQVAIYRLHRQTGSYQRTYSWHAPSSGPLANRVDPETLSRPRAPGQVAVPIDLDGGPCYLTLKAGSHVHSWTDGIVHDLSLIAEVFAQAVALRRAVGSLGDVTGRLINAQEAERRRIGRELHDHIGPHMALLSLIAEEIRQPAVASVKATRQNVNKLRRQIVEVSRELHELSHRLHSATLEAHGLIPALRRLVAEFSGHHGLMIGFRQSAVPSRLAPDVSLCLFRVAEESLNNVVKHSRARSAHIDVTGKADEIQLTVHDYGVGFDTAASRVQTGLGIVSMRERLRLVLGTINIESTPALGTTVMVRVPTGV